MLFNLKLIVIPIFSSFFLIPFITSYEEQQTTQQIAKPDQEKQANENLYSKEQTIKLFKEIYGERGQRLDNKIDHRKELKFIYSAAIYSDSIFTIGYQPSYFRENGGVLFDEDINSGEWLKAKNEIIDIYDKTDKVPCQPGEPLILPDVYTMMFPTPVEKLPYLKFKSTSYEFLKQVSQLEGKISSIESNMENLAWEALYGIKIK